jgi:hypothetical protein
MLYTFFEAYLEDGLATIAEKNPSLLTTGKTIEARMAFDVESIEELRRSVRKDWAQSILRGGGPAKWAKRLIDFGAKGYAEADIATAEHLWDTRNLIIHTQGVPRLDYKKRYPSQAMVDGRVKVGAGEFSNWIRAVHRFVQTTDAFLLKYKT